ncbi:MAG: hypothetical protein IPI23_04080 [Bacteroidetes bacterium]|nr:hypothetical protein [Bacteroidota bacterium]
MKKILIILMLFVFSGSCIAQKRNAVWCFGDSAGIDFSNLGSPQVFSTSLDTRGSCASIADTSGQLLFYAETNGNLSSNSTQVYSSIGQKCRMETVSLDNYGTMNCLFSHFLATIHCIIYFR